VGQRRRSELARDGLTVMAAMTHPTQGPEEPVPVPGGDVREPPVPAEREEERLPGNDELRDPEDGGGKIKKRL